MRRCLRRAGGDSVSLLRFRFSLKIAGGGSEELWGAGGRENIIGDKCFTYCFLA